MCLFIFRLAVPTTKSCPVLKQIHSHAYAYYYASLSIPFLQMHNMTVPVDCNESKVIIDEIGDDHLCKYVATITLTTGCKKS